MSRTIEQEVEIQFFVKNVKSSPYVNLPRRHVHRPHLLEMPQLWLNEGCSCCGTRPIDNKVKVFHCRARL